MKNEIIIHGYIGRDPELSEVQGQNGPFMKTVFSLGVARDYGDETDWFRCEVTGKRAEVVEKFFRKGSQILVTGRMESYKPKNDPERTAWKVKVFDFDFCDRSGAASNDADPNGFEELRDDDVPF